MTRPVRDIASTPTPSFSLIPTNGQVAARMVSPLGQWRRFDGERQRLMKAELQRILDLPGLSPQHL